MEIRTKITGDKMEIMLKGRMDTNTSPEFEKEVFPKLEGIKEIILDMENLSYISSAGLRVVLLCQKKMNTAAGTMVVKNVNELVMEVFSATGFDTILTIENER